MQVSVSDAKGQLTDLVRRAEAGDDIILTRHGRPVATLKALGKDSSKLSGADLEWLAARRITPKPGAETPSQSLAWLRDEDER